MKEFGIMYLHISKNGKVLYLRGDNRGNEVRKAKDETTKYLLYHCNSDLIMRGFSWHGELFV